MKVIQTALFDDLERDYEELQKKSKIKGDKCHEKK